MLKNTFQHLPGIGTKTEQRIWAAGILDWDGFKTPFPTKRLRMSLRKIEADDRDIQESQKQLEHNNPKYFAECLPPNLHWRLFPEFRDSTVYLDIETTGMDSYYGSITTIALYDGRVITWYVKDQNLADFKTDIQKYSTIISYNGKCFDVPFIESNLGIHLDHVHIDLRYVLASLGFKGGLKRCETLLGMDRGDLAGVDGFFAVLLWNDYQTNNDPKALETLLAYNIQDVVTLENLMVTAYNKKIKETPFADSHRLSPAPAPPIQFKANLETIERIKRQNYFYDVRNNF